MYDYFAWCAAVLALLPSPGIAAQDIQFGERRLIRLTPAGDRTALEASAFRGTRTAERDATIYLRVLSTEIDPILHVEDASGHLLAEDDDSGGGHDAFVILHVNAGLAFTCVITNKSSAGGEATLIAREAPDAPQVIEAASSAREKLENCRQARSRGDLASARSAVREGLDGLEAAPDSFRSASAVSVLEEIGKIALECGDPKTSSEAWGEVLRHRQEFFPEDHATVQLARAQLAIAKKNLGDFDGARVLEERVLEARTRLLPETDMALQAARGNLANTLRQLGEFDRALVLQEKVLDAFTRNLPEEHLNVQKARMNLGSTLYFLGRYERARALLEQALRVLERTSSEDQPELILSREMLSLVLGDLGDLHRALALQQEVLRVRSRTLPDYHADLQWARANLAVTLRELGDLDGARSLEEKVLEVRIRLLPEDHIDVQKARNNLATTMEALGDLAGARALYEKAYSALLRTRPPGHPDLLIAEQDLATLMGRQGDLRGARPMLEEVLEARLRTRPAEDPDVLSAKEDLAVLLHDLGDLHGARKLKEECLESALCRLPEDHPDVLKAETNLAATLDSLGEVSRARNLLEGVLRVRLQTLPADHPDVLTVRLTIAGLHREIGELDRAREILVDVLANLERIFPDDHPNVQTARSTLALTIQEQGDLEGARLLEERICDVYSRTLPPEHPDRLGALGNLAGTYAAQGRLATARALEEQFLEMATRMLPDDHPSLQGARANLAGTLRKVGDFARARLLEEKVLDVWSRTLPDDHPDLQIARLNLAATLRRAKDLRAAKSLQEKVLVVRTTALPDDHPSVSSVRAHLASTLFELGDLEGARVLEEKVLDVRSRNLAETHPFLQMARINLAVTLKAMGEWARARELEEKAVEVLSRTLVDDHPDLESARNNLARTRLVMGDVVASRSLTRDLLRGVRRRLALAACSVSPREAESIAIDCKRSLSTALSITAGAGLAEPDGELSEQTLGVIELARSIALSNRRLLRQRSVSHAQVPDAEKNTERGSFESLRASDYSGVAMLEKLRAKEQTERSSREAFLDANHDQDPSLGADLESIASTLATDEAAIGFWRYSRSRVEGRESPRIESEDSLLALVLRRGAQPVRVELGPILEIERAVADWRAALGAAPDSRGVTIQPRTPSTDHESGARLRALVLDPLEPALGDATHLVVAPDDVLHLVPLDALPDRLHGVSTAPDPDADPRTGDRRTVFLCPTLALLRVHTDVIPGTPVLLALGGVDYDADPVSGSSREGSSTAPSIRTDDVTRDRVANLVLAGAPRSGMSTHAFARLPATGPEVEEIAAIFRQAHVSTAVTRLIEGGDATRDAFGRLATDARFVHLATHGYFAPESIQSARDPRPIDEKTGLGEFTSPLERIRGLAPMLMCGIAFAGSNRASDADEVPEGVMTAEQLADLDLSHCELAVLSACDTHLGELRAGQGVASLQTALHAAGAHMAITSLWKVPDEATHRLMIEFYRRLWVGNERPEIALWGAKQVLREAKDANGRPKHSPRDWAAWVLSRG